MMRTIGATSHGIIDYALAILLAMGPSVAGFAGRQATWAYVFAGVLFAMAVLTRYPLGAFRVIRLTIHGAIELLLAIIILVLPWVANFSAGVLSRNFYVGMGVLMIAIWLLTDFRGIRDRKRV